MVLALSGGVLGWFVALWSNDLIGRSIPIGATETLHLEMNGPSSPRRSSSRCSAACSRPGPRLDRLAGRHGHHAEAAEPRVHLRPWRPPPPERPGRRRGGARPRASGHRRRDDPGIQRPAEAHKGWDTDRVLLANIHMAEQSTYNTEDKRRVAIDKLTRRLAQIPHAERTAICSSPPLFAYSKNVSFEVSGVTSDDPTKQPSAATPWSPRTFSPPSASAAGGPSVPVGAEGGQPAVGHHQRDHGARFWPHESAIGRRIGDRQATWSSARDHRRRARHPDALNPSDLSTMYQVYKPLVNEPWDTCG